MLPVIVNVTHHQRGARCSTTPEIRSVSQLKLRLFRTSGTRASLVTEVDASSRIASGAVGSVSIVSQDRQGLRSTTSFCSRLFLRAGNADAMRVWHSWIGIANTGEI